MKKNTEDYLHLTLHYAKRGCDEIKEIQIKIDDIDYFYSMELPFEGTVFLVAIECDILGIDNEIMVTSKQGVAKDFMTQAIEEFVCSTTKEILKSKGLNIFLQEYNSFEAAYEVALNMKEIDSLCYELDNSLLN
jgi:hypothetical protein